MKKKCGLFISSLLVLALVGCSTNNETSPSSQNPQTSSGDVSSEPGTTSDSSSAPVTIKYTITFKDENGTILDSREWDEGTVPSYNYQKEDTAEWDYTFDGWSTTQDGDPITIPAASSNATYYALVSKVKNKYTITFNSNGGSSVNPITEDYGTLVNKPSNPSKDEKAFVAWTIDSVGGETVSWPLTLDKNYSLYANWNDAINIKDYLSTLINVKNQSPYSYIPETMRGTYTPNQVTRSAVTYDFNTSTQVNNIKYGGFGEQWHMVLENIAESQRFYNILAGVNTAISASVVLFNNYLDNNPGDTADHELDEATYTAKIDYHDGVLKYSIRLKTGIDIPLFGNVTPQVDMEYEILTGFKTVRINLSENNALKYIVSENSYAFGIEYGIDSVSRKAYFDIGRNPDTGLIQGHIYEFVQYKDKDLVPACADFYIYDDYVSAVGNKASGIIGFNNYINELYNVNTGKLLGYEVREEKTVLGVNVQFNTLWFNMNNITGVNAVRYIDNDHAGSEEEVGFYLNGSSTEFKTTNFGGLTKKTASRRYDVEFRKQYFYAVEDDKLVDIEVEVPMMFIQEEKLSDFPSDVASANSGMTVSVNLSSIYLEKIQSDYQTLIDVFIENKELVGSAEIVAFIGDPEVI